MMILAKRKIGREKEKINGRVDGFWIFRSAITT